VRGAEQVPHGGADERVEGGAPPAAGRLVEPSELGGEDAVDLLARSPPAALDCPGQRHRARRPERRRPHDRTELLVQSSPLVAQRFDAASQGLVEVDRAQQGQGMHCRVLHAGAVEVLEAREVGEDGPGRDLGTFSHPLGAGAGVPLGDQCE
jgi:hypothetical protein